MWLCKTLCLKSRMRIECFLITVFLHWIEEICWWISTHTSSFAALDTKFRNGLGVTYPNSGLSDTKELNEFTFPFFSCKIYKKENTSKAILSLHTFQGLHLRSTFIFLIQLHDQSRRVWPTLKVYRHPGEKLRTFKTTFLKPHIFL